MCGFFAVVHNANGCLRDFNANDFERLKKRGPDSAGTFHSKFFNAVHYRLAINDTSHRSNQPFVSDDGRYILVYNGEIYNFRELKAQYLSNSNFKTFSDTEVLLKLFEKYGPESLKYLRGMYAFAIWDTISCQIFVARDQLGIKPLYYYFDGKSFSICSQAKVLARYYSKQIDEEVRRDFISFGSVIGPKTIFEGIYEFPAASYATYNVDSNKLCIDPSPVPTNCDLNNYSECDITACVSNSVIDSVRSHLVSDVDVGLFLSGGVDSSTILAIANQCGVSLRCVTVAFNEFVNSNKDEGLLSSIIAKQYGAEHHIRRFTFEDFEGSIDQFIDDMDQPTIDGLNTWFASKAANELGIKVALSGVGADELFSGYRTYSQLKTMDRYVKIAQKFNYLKYFVRYIASVLNNSKLYDLAFSEADQAKLYAIKRSVFTPHSLKNLYGECEAHKIFDSIVKNVSQACFSTDKAIASYNMYDINVYMRNQLLRDSDWAGMSHSIEVRTPFVDSVLYDKIKEFAPYFSNGKGKRFMYEIPDYKIPIEVLNRSKMGFSVPISLWLSRLSSFKSRRVELNATQNWALYIAERFN